MNDIEDDHYTYRPANLPRKLIIQGGRQLQGNVSIAGAKNAILPIMAASLLTDKKILVRKIPQLDDVALMAQILCGLGIVPEIITDASLILGGSAKSLTIPRHQASLLRTSILTFGPMLVHYGEVRLPFPGGCPIGRRPIDIHIKAMEMMGAKVKLLEDGIYATAPNGLTGTTIRFPVSSVGATENAMIAAAGAKGTTIIENAAAEPEVCDLGLFLTRMGVVIQGLGTRRLVIEGRTEFDSCEHTVIPDRIEAGTYLVAATATRSSVVLEDCNPHHMTAVLEQLSKAGAKIDIDEQNNSLQLDMQGKQPRAVQIASEPYPGFPTDMLAQFTAMNAVAKGRGSVTENIFPDRNKHVMEMQKMNAQLELDGNIVHSVGTEKLIGTEVRASDLRASACLVIAALVAEGETSILDIHHIDRGYEWVSEKLKKIGASVHRELVFDR